jgi:hypothetical protein
MIVYLSDDLHTNHYAKTSQLRECLRLQTPSTNNSGNITLRAKRGKPPNIRDEIELKSAENVIITSNRTCIPAGQSQRLVDTGNQ